VLAETRLVWKYDGPGIEKIIMQYAFEFIKGKFIKGNLNLFEKLDLSRGMIDKNTYDPKKNDEVVEFIQIFNIDDERIGGQSIGF
jgi:hypothetical protein